MHGNVWEWVEDCYEESYAGAPDDGRARTRCGKNLRVLRGGSLVQFSAMVALCDARLGRAVES